AKLSASRATLRAWRPRLRPRPLAAVEKDNGLQKRLAVVTLLHRRPVRQVQKQAGLWRWHGVSGSDIVATFLRALSTPPTPLSVSRATASAPILGLWRTARVSQSDRLRRARIVKRDLRLAA